MECPRYTIYLYFAIQICNGISWPFNEMTWSHEFNFVWSTILPLYIFNACKPLAPSLIKHSFHFVTQIQIMSNIRRQAKIIERAKKIKTLHNQSTVKHLIKFSSTRLNFDFFRWVLNSFTNFIYIYIYIFNQLVIDTVNSKSLCYFSVQTTSSERKKKRTAWSKNNLFCHLN